MTLNEAILRQENMVDQSEGEIGGKDAEALRLTLEAAKKYEHLRNPIDPDKTLLLPGETEE